MRSRRHHIHPNTHDFRRESGQHVESVGGAYGEYESRFDFIGFESLVINEYVTNLVERHAPVWFCVSFGFRRKVTKKLFFEIENKESFSPFIFTSLTQFI